MSAEEQPPQPTFGRNSVYAFVAVVLAGYASVLGILNELGPWQLVLLVLLGVVYVAFGLAGDTWCDRTFRRAGKPVFFGFQLLVGAAIVLLGRTGLIGLALFPLASQAAIVLSPRGIAVVCAAIVAILGLPIAFYANITAAVQASLSWGAGIMFVVVFTQVATSEQRLRREAERLAGELGEANRQLREYAAQVEELAVARERNRMAREIHDSLGHYLTAVNIQLEAARAVLASDPAQAQDALSKAQGLTREGLADVRRSGGCPARSARGPTVPWPKPWSDLVRQSEAAGVARCSGGARRSPSVGSRPPTSRSIAPRRKASPTCESTRAPPVPK